MSAEKEEQRYPVVYAQGLSKWYKQVIGLNNFNLDIKPGITGIVGPNGSGKSTLFKIMLGMIRVNNGDIWVMGQRPWANPFLLEKMGFCPDYEYLPSETTGREFLRFVGGLHKMSGDVLESRIGEVTAIVGMLHALDRKMGGYSKGMKQRIKVAVSIIHNPQLVLLDEPLSGTDPLVRRDLVELIKRLNKEHGHDIIVSSHVLHDVEKMTRDVVLIYKGRAIASGSITEIRGLIDKHPHNIVIEGKGIGDLAKRLLDEKYVVSVGYNKDRTGILAQVSRPEEFFDDIAEIVATTECQVEKMCSLDDNLEAVFKYLVGGIG